MTHTHALLDWDCWIDRNPHPGDCGRWQGPGHVLPGASVGEEEGAEKARSTGTHASGRQGSHGSTRNPKASRCLICSAEGDWACLHCSKQRNTEQALDSQQSLLLMETSPKGLNICWGLCTKKGWQYVLLLIFSYTQKFTGLSNVYSSSAANLISTSDLPRCFSFLFFLCNKRLHSLKARDSHSNVSHFCAHRRETGELNEPISTVSFTERRG